MNSNKSPASAIVVMDFGEAIRRAKTGARIARIGWNGKGMWVCHLPGVVIPEGMVNARVRKYIPAGELNVGPYFVMFTAQGVWQPGWLASQNDMLAEDWFVIDESAQ